MKGDKNMNPKSWNCNCSCNSTTNTNTNKRKEESESSMSNRECSMILKALIEFDDTLSETTKKALKRALKALHTEEFVTATINSVLGKEKENDKF